MTVITKEDQQIFKEWLELDLVSISWEGRFLTDFNDFWASLFKNDNSAEKQFKDLEYVISQISEGPMISWFRWIREKFICFLFIYKSLSINELSSLSGLDLSDVSLYLRIFFVERFPHLEERINDFFSNGNIIKQNNSCDTLFIELKEDLSIESDLRGKANSDILNNLEITLYAEWNKLKASLPSSSNEKKETYKKQKSRTYTYLKFARDLILLFVLGAIFILLVKLGNNYYEGHLVKKISLLESNFFWLDRNLTFNQDSLVSNNEIEIDQNELEKLEQLESKAIFDDQKIESRFEVESDVVLTSVDSLPKDFNDVEFEKSNYEEFKKGGFRNMRYGRRKAYRVMMTSVQPKLTKKQIIKYLKDFGVKQVDNVKPGTEIPGGMYFNLYVPIRNLKSFLLKVSSVQESTILESKTILGGPKGTSRVFIWVKSI